MKTAACYIRVSTEDQLEYSPDAQLREIRKYAAANDIFLDPNHIYMDEGISGRQTKNRTAFNQMIGTAKLKPKPFDIILLWKFSRFARNREDAIVYKSMLRKLGIEVISITENTGDDKMSVLVEAMIEAMDEYYSINLGEEVIRGMTQKALTGGIQTNPSFGYDKFPNQTYTINADEAPYVRMIFEQYLNGKSLTAIARHLNSLNVRTKKGNKFEARQIEYMLNNPVYKGYIRWTPTKTVGKRIYDSPDTITVKSDHEPIISEETWNEAQQLYQTHKATRKPYDRAPESKKHYLSGLLYCGNCGHRLTYNKSYNSFQCYQYAKGICAYSCFITVPQIERLILEQIESLAAGEKFFLHKKPAINPPDESAILEKEITSLEEILLKAKKAYLAGIDTLDEYGDNKRRIQKQIAELREKQKNIAHPKVDDRIEKINVDDLKKLILSDSSPQEKSKALSSIFEKIIYRRHPVEELTILIR
jgi:DNA invertase Pin-like site-specific DNA recombinase